MKRLIVYGALGLAMALGCSANKSSERTPRNMNGGPGTDPSMPFPPSTGGDGNPFDIDPNTTPDQPVALVDPESNPFIVDDTGSSGLDQGTIDALEAGGSGCSFNLLYPYGGTVFPVGLMAPTVMWDTGADSAYIRFTYDGTNSVSYEYATGPTDPGEITIPQAAWNEITVRSAGASLLRMTVSAMSGGAVSTCESTLEIAPGVMNGSVYYNTYNAPGAAVAGNGAVMRFQLGQPQSDIYLQWLGPVNPIPGTGPCTSCHSVSANGSTIVASNHSYDPIGNKFFDVFSAGVTPQTQPPPMSQLENAVFGGLHPDGTQMLTMGNPDCTLNSEGFPRSSNNFPLVEGPDHAKVVDTATGHELPSNGLDPSWYMWMPQFPAVTRSSSTTRSRTARGGQIDASSRSWTMTARPTRSRI